MKNSFDKYGEYKLKKGDKIKISLNDDKFKNYIEGEYVDSIAVPIFMTKEMGLVCGVECWWIPSKEADRIEKKFNKIRRKEKCS